ncbi:hypothetical protein GW781_00980 [bacterium]|nr:hypothetical protein [bacterium]
MNIFGRFLTGDLPAPERPLTRWKCWQVIRDPTGRDFQGRFFAQIDLDASAENNTWPDGIVFCNQVSGRRMRFRAGKLETF